MQIKKVKHKTEYLLCCDAGKKQYVVYVHCLHEAKRLIIKPKHGGGYFEFNASEPELVRAIGELLIEASKVK